MKAKVLGTVCFNLCLAAVQAGFAQSTPPPAGTSHPGMPATPPAPKRDTVKHEDQHRANGGNHQPGGGGANGQPGQQHNALQLGPIGRWWDDKSVVASIGLSMQQQKKMDSIFDANRDAIVNSFKAFQKAQEHLQAVNKKAHPDRDQVFAAIDAVNQARSDLQKAASVMLLQIRGEMSQDQIDKLEKLQ